MAKKTAKVTQKLAKDPMVEHVAEEFKRYEIYHNDRFDAMKDIYDMWNNVPPPRSYDWQNAVHVPLTSEGEQTITPRLFTALFPNDAPVDVQAEGDAPKMQGIKMHMMSIRHAGM